MKPYGLILDGTIRVGSFNFIQGEDYTKCKITDAEIELVYVNLPINRSYKLHFMITTVNEDGTFRLVKDLGMGVVEGGTFVDDKKSYFRDVRFIQYNKNSELN